VRASTPRKAFSRTNLQVPVIKLAKRSWSSDIRSCSANREHYKNNTPVFNSCRGVGEVD
jgi:hypothetical protein